MHPWLEGEDSRSSMSDITRLDQWEQRIGRKLQLLRGQVARWRGRGLADVLD